MAAVQVLQALEHEMSTAARGDVLGRLRGKLVQLGQPGEAGETVAPAHGAGKSGKGGGKGKKRNQAAKHRMKPAELELLLSVAAHSKIEVVPPTRLHEVATAQVYDGDPAVGTETRLLVLRAALACVVFGKLGQAPGGHGRIPGPVTAGCAALLVHALQDQTLEYALDMPGDAWFGGHGSSSCSSSFASVSHDAARCTHAVCF
eukprot:SAG22_NODE_3592_length_1628_cov_1.277305_2_plen_203_part_00